MFTVTAGYSGSIPENAAGSTLVTFAATDPDASTTLTWSWGGSVPHALLSLNTATGAISTTGGFDFEAMSSNPVTGTVDVSDGSMTASRAFSLSITNVDEAPEFTVDSGGSRIPITENSATGTAVFSFTAVDPEGAAITYALEASGSSTSLLPFLSVSASGSVTLLAGLDFEGQVGGSPAVVNREVTVRASQAGGAFSDTHVLRLRLVDVNEEFTVPSSLTLSVAEDTTAGSWITVGHPGHMTATEPDSPLYNSVEFGEVTWSITSQTPSNVFRVRRNSATIGQLGLANGRRLNTESATTHTVQLQAEDNGGAATYFTKTVTLTVTVVDVNEPPDNYSPPSLSAAELQLAATVIGTVTATDPEGVGVSFTLLTGGTCASGDYAVSSAGSITFARPVRYTAASPSCTLRVQGTDASPQLLTSEHTITITLTDVNEQPTVQYTEFRVNENVASGTPVLRVGGSHDPPIHEDADLAVNDQDGDTLTYALEATRQDSDPLGDFLFQIDPSSGLISTKTSLLNYERFAGTTGAVNVTVRVTDAGGLSASTPITVHIQDRRDVPTFTQASYTYSVDENSPAGTQMPLGSSAVQAVDEDAGQTALLQYSIVNADPASGTGKFTLDPASGVLTLSVAGGASLSFEDEGSFNLTVRVRDPDADYRDVGVLFNINDVPEKPYFTSNFSLSIDENSAVGAVVGAVSATEEDGGDTTAYSITGGNSEGMFAVDSGTGQVTVALDRAGGGLFLDFERLSSYRLRVRATDGAGAWDEARLDIAVVDRNDPPMYDAPALFMVQEHFPLGGPPAFVLHATDEDGDDVTYTITAGNAVAPLTDAFVIENAAANTTALVRPARDLNYEDGQPRQYNLTVRLIDDGSKPGGPQVTDVAISVRITNTQDQPLLQPASLTIPENSAPGSPAGTVLALDEDIPEQGQALTYTFTGRSEPAALQRFVIDPVSGDVTVASGVGIRPGEDSGVDFEVAPAHRVEVRVVDNGAPPLQHLRNYTITVQNINEPPILLTLDQYMPENVPAGTVAADIPGAMLQLMNGLYRTGAIRQANLTALLQHASPIRIIDPDSSETQGIQVDAVLMLADPVRLPGANSSVNMTSFSNDVYPSSLHGDIFTNSEAFPVWQSRADTCSNGMGLLCPNGTSRALGWTSAAREPAVEFTLRGNSSTAPQLVSLGASLNFEARALYQFAFHLQDSAAALSPGSTDVVVLYNLHITDVNEPTTVRQEGVPTARENELVGTCLNQYALTVIDPDVQTLQVELTPASAGELLYFTVVPQNSSLNADGTRDPLRLCVSRAGLPTGQQTLNMRTLDMSDPSKHSGFQLIAITVNDVNDQPVLPVAGSPALQASVDEMSGVSTRVLRVAAQDVDMYQDLTYTVEGTLSSHFRFERIPLPLTANASCSEDDNLNKPYDCAPQHVVDYFTQKHGQAHLYREAWLVVDRDAIDFEAMQSVDGGRYLVRIRVTDIPFISRGGVYALDSEEPELSANSQAALLVVDIPDIPVVDRVVPFTPFGLTTTGGESVTLHGSNFGPALLAHPLLAPADRTVPMVVADYFSSTLNTQFNTSNCEVVVAYTTMRCFSVPGFGAGYQWRVHIGGFLPYKPGVIVQTSNYSANTTRYASPNVASFTGPGHDLASTVGGQLVTVEGSQFGTVAANRIDSVTYGPTGEEYAATNCDVVQDHSVIQCTTVAGVGGDLRWVVNIAGQTSQTPTTNYAPPIVTGVRVSSNSSLPATDGGAVFEILGRNFGAIAENPPAVDDVRYGLPEVASVYFPGGNGQDIVAPGGNWTAPNGTRRLEGEAAWGAAEWGTGMTALAHPGARELFSSLSTSTSAEDSTVEATEPSLVPLLTQPYVVTSNSRLRSSAFLAEDCAVVSDHTVIQCRMAAGAGANLHVQVTVRGQSSLLSNATVRYAPPQISDVFLLDDNDVKSRKGGTRGGTRVTITGANFGRAQDAPSVLFGMVLYNSTTRELLSEPRRRVLPASSVSPSSHSELRFDYPPGNGANVSIWAKVRTQVSLQATSFGYLPPTITSLQYMRGAANDLPIVLRVHGSNFGRCCFRFRHMLQDPSSTPTQIDAMQSSCVCVPGTVEEVVIDQLQTQNNVTLVTASSQANITASTYSDSMIEVHTDLINGDLQVHVGGQSSAYFPYSFAALLAQPSIDNIEVWDFASSTFIDHAAAEAVKPTSGKDSVNRDVFIRLVGTNFGGSPGSVQFMYYYPADTFSDQPPHFVQAQSGRPPNAAVPSTWWNDRAVYVRLPAGQGRPVVKLVYPDAPNTLALYRQFQYNLPNVTAVTGAFGPSNGFIWRQHAYAPRDSVSGIARDTELLTLRGVNLGSPLKLSASDAVLPGGGASGMQFQGGLSLSTTVGVNGTVLFEPALRYESSVTVGGKQCLIVTWGDEFIQCAAPPGVGRALDIVIWVHTRFTDASTVFDQRMRSATAPIKYSYDAPDGVRLSCHENMGVTDTCVTHGGTDGGQRLFIHGRSLGIPGTAQVRIDGALPLQMAHLSHNLIRIDTPPGEGMHLDMVVSVEGQSHTLSAFHYDPPRITCISNGSVCASPANGTLLNALSAAVFIEGANFGVQGNTPGRPADEVNIGGVRCTNGDTGVFTRSTRLQCNLADQTVGNKSLFMMIGNQQLSFPEDARVVQAVCPEGFYGSVPGVDRCIQCPTSRCSLPECTGEVASICTGGLTPPIAAPGYWRLDTQDGTVDLSQFDLNSTAGSGGRWAFTRCEPKAACLAGNVCAFGYTGAACSICLPGQYQRNLISGACEPCPDNATLYTLGIIILVLIMALVLYKLYKKGPSVAALGIAVDYLQILSVFGTLNLRWPASVGFVFRIASASAASVDTASPECSVQLGYVRKWFITVGFPFGVACMFLVMHVCIVLFKKLFKKKGDRTNLYKHVPGMIGFVFMMLSFLYITLSAKSFEALECKDVGGESVLAVDSEVKCGSEEYRLLQRWAFAAVFAYGLGVPVLFGAIILRTSARMKADQALRIQNLSGSRDTNPFFDFQKKYKRLYFKYKPEHHYWLLVILARKFLIVLVAAQLKSRPMMAATSTVVILFAACIAQLTQMPYRQHETQSKKDALASGALGSDVPPALLAAIRERQVAASSQRAAKAGAAAGMGRGTTKAKALLGAEGAVVSSNPLSMPAAPTGATSARRSSKGVAVHGRGVDLKYMANDRSVLWANDPQFMQATSKPSSARGRGASVVARLKGAQAVQPVHGNVWFRQSNNTDKRTSMHPSALSSRSLQRKGLKGIVRDTSTPSTSAAHQPWYKRKANSKGSGTDSKQGAQAPRADPPNSCCSKFCTPCRGALRCVMRFGTAGNAKEGLKLREESRKGGHVKVKIKYLFNYNALEATFLVCAIFVLLSGIMFRTAEESGELHNQTERTAMEVMVMVILLGSTFVCLSTVFAELFLGMQYTLWAAEVRRKREQEYKREKKLEQTLMGKTDAPACAVWCNSWCGCCPAACKGSRACRKCYHLPDQPLVAQPAHPPMKTATRRRSSIKDLIKGLARGGSASVGTAKAPPFSAARSSVRSTRAASRRRSQAGSVRSLLRSASIALGRPVQPAPVDAVSDSEADSNLSSEEEDVMEEQIKAAERAKAGRTAKFGSRYNGEESASMRALGGEGGSAGGDACGPVVRELVPATPEQYQHMKGASALSITEAQVRRQAIMTRLKAVAGKVHSNRRRDAMSSVVGKRQHHPQLSRLTGGLATSVGDSKASPAGGADVSVASPLLAAAAVGPGKRSARRVPASVAYSAEAAAELGLVRGMQTTDASALRHLHAMRDAEADPLTQKMALGQGSVHGASASALAAVNALTKHQQVSRYMVSAHLGRVVGLTNIAPGTMLRVALKLNSKSEKVSFEYKPNQDMRVREMRLFVFNPNTDTVIGTLYASRSGQVSAGVVEDVVGHFTFQVADLPNPLDSTDRVPMTLGLLAYDGTIAGQILFLLRLQHRGSMMDDWTELNMGARHSNQVPAPGDDAFAAARRASQRAKHQEQRDAEMYGCAVGTEDVGFEVGMDAAAGHRMGQLAGSDARGDGPLRLTRSGSSVQSAENPMHSALRNAAAGGTPKAPTSPPPATLGSRSGVDSMSATMLAAAGSGALRNTSKGHDATNSVKDARAAAQSEQPPARSRSQRTKRLSIDAGLAQAKLKKALGLGALHEEFATQQGGNDLMPYSEAEEDAALALDASSAKLLGNPMRAVPDLPQLPTLLEAGACPVSDTSPLQLLDSMSPGTRRVSIDRRKRDSFAPVTGSRHSTFGTRVGVTSAGAASSDHATQNARRGIRRRAGTGMAGYTTGAVLKGGNVLRARHDAQSLASAMSSLEGEGGMRERQLGSTRRRDSMHNNPLRSTVETDGIAPRRVDMASLERASTRGSSPEVQAPTPPTAARLPSLLLPSVPEQLAMQSSNPLHGRMSTTSSHGVPRASIRPRRTPSGSLARSIGPAHNS